MARFVRFLSIIVMVAHLLTLVSFADVSKAVSAATTAVAPFITSDLVPLPGGCGGGLPPGDTVPTCCVFGYVIIDGQPVAGAKVTITSVHGRMEYVTDFSLKPTVPTYRMNLSASPLSVQRGDTITIQADYSGHTQTITHVALGGSQQVDVVLPRNQADDYVFDKQIWQPGAPGTFLSVHSVALDGAGTVYVVDGQNARVQVFNHAGQFLRQWGSLGNGPGQFFSPQGIAVDRQGFVYVTDSLRVQKFSNTGGWIATWGGQQGNGDGQFYKPMAVAIDANGFVYIADMRNYRIQKLTSDGVFVAKWGAQGSGNGQFELPTGIAIDGDGFVYVADSGNNRIEKFTSDGIFITAWGTQGSGNAQFNTNPLEAFSLAIDGAGFIYATDTGNHRVQKFTTGGVWVATWGGPLNGSANGQFAYPHGVAVDSDGSVYVADRNNHRIQRLSAAGDWQLTFGSQSSGAGLFNGPWSSTLDGKGNLYVADTGNGIIQKLTVDGVWQHTWGGIGSNPGQFGFAQGIAVDPNGNVFVTDAGSSRERIQKFDGNGNLIIVWGSFGSNDGQFSNPIGISADSSGNIYVADAGNNRVQKFTNAGTWLATWGGSPWQFNSPHGVFADANGSVYVTDTNNNRVLKLRSSDGMVLATWGSSGAANGQFAAPAGVTGDADGNLYITDQHRIQKFASDLTWRATWSTYGNGIGQVSGPVAPSVDSTGRVYVADQGNDRIQIFRPMTYTKPIATIVAVSPLSVVQGAGSMIDLLGRGGTSLPSGLIIDYMWTLDESPTSFAVTDAATLDTSGLTLGEHSITLRVRDGAGVLSDPQRITIKVTTQPSDPHGQTWTFLLYLDGDNAETAPFLNAESQFGALYRLQHISRNPNVSIAALYDGPAQEDSVRYILKPDGTVTHESLPEQDMGDLNTLVDFVKWGKLQAPADHYYLAIADHANGIDGIAWDYSNSPVDHLTNGELRNALQIITQNGALPIDVLHLDGCLMGLIENAYQVRGLARYVVVSENLGWSAFAYYSYQQAVGSNTSPRELATAVADRYAQIISSYGYPYTIAALDLSHVDDVERAMKVLSSELLRYTLASPANRDVLISVRNQAQKLDYSGDIRITNDDVYVDLSDWAGLIQAGVSDTGIVDAAGAVRMALTSLVVREHHASGTYSGAIVDLERTHGVAIYYPPQASAKTYQVYAQGDLIFPVDSGWGAFLSGGLAALPFDSAQPVAHLVPPLPLTKYVYLSMVRR